MVRQFGECAKCASDHNASGGGHVRRPRLSIKLLSPCLTEFCEFGRVRLSDLCAKIGAFAGIERMRSPRYWQNRAEEFRVKADNCAYPETRDALRAVAKNYDDLARSAEQIRRIAEAPPRLRDMRTMNASYSRSSPGQMNQGRLGGDLPRP